MFISETHACLRTMFLVYVIFHYFLQLQFTCISIYLYTKGCIFYQYALNFSITFWGSAAYRHAW